MPQEGTEVTPEGQKPEGTPTPEGQNPDEGAGTTPEAKPEGGDKPEGKKTGFEDLPQETQDEIKRLRSEAASNRKTAQDAQAKLDEIEDANKSEKERAEAKAAREAERATKAETELLRYKIASEKKIPADAVGLLTATTQEELEAQAEQILKLRGSSGEGASDFGGGAREQEPEQLKPEEAHRRGILGILGLEPAPPE